MPLQNRIDPFGAIHAVPERGSLMGNRGIIHDPHTRTLLKKRWALKAWIICVCDFRGVRRVPMGSNRVVDGERRAGWTELFFLDEVTALAAGHRPWILSGASARRTALTSRARPRWTTGSTRSGWPPVDEPSRWEARRWRPCPTAR